MGKNQRQPQDMTERFNKSLIIITPGFPKDDHDTNCLPFQQQFVECLRTEFPELEVIVFSLQYPYHTKEYYWKKSRVVPLNGKGLSKIGRLFFWWKSIRKIKTFVKAETIGILSFWCNESALIGQYVARQTKKQHQIWIMGQDARRSNLLVKFIRPKAHQLIALSNHLKIEFTKNHRITPHYVIGNGVMPEKFMNNTSERPVELIGVGSLTELKRYNIFVNVCRAIHESGRSVTAEIVGDGPAKTEISALISEYRLESCVRMSGLVSHAQVIEKMSTSRILLHPSSYEGYSTVCLEALAAGCHVVSFVSPQEDQIKKWHVVNSEAEMIETVNRILSSPPDHSSVIVNTIKDSALQILALFSHPARRQASNSFNGSLLK